VAIGNCFRAFACDCVLAVCLFIYSRQILSWANQPHVVKIAKELIVHAVFYGVAFSRFIYPGNEPPVWLIVIVVLALIFVAIQLEQRLENHPVRDYAARQGETDER
jgi:hypothetical protein